MSEPNEATTDIIIKGRPDMEDRQFGKTRAKRHPKYVYGTASGLLMHEVAYVELHWYDFGPGGHSLIRRDSPRITITTCCGQLFHAQPRHWNRPNRDGKPRATICDVPNPDAVLCGRCRGEGPVFGKNGTGNVTKREAKDRLGCDDVIQL